jgi:VWFA-related protein
MNSSRINASSLSAAGLLCGMLLLGFARIAATQEASPRFQSAVEVASVDVIVVDNRGRPVLNLGPGDFTVRIDGAPRRVVSAQWISLAGNTQVAAPPAVEGYSSNERMAGGRLIVIAVDQPNIHFGAGVSVTAAAGAFVDQLSPADRVAVVGLGLGSQPSVFSGNRQRIKQALSRLVGQKVEGHGRFNIAMTEALGIYRGDMSALRGVVARECGSGDAAALMDCQSQVQAEAAIMFQNASREADETIRDLRDLFTGLKTFDAPKTLVLISEGFVTDNDVLPMIDLGRMAAESRTNVYVLHLDGQTVDIADSRMPAAPFNDRRERMMALEELASSAQGAVFSVSGSGAPVFDRINAEMSGYYLLGIEADPRDRESEGHPIRVDVARRSVTVRARRQALSSRVPAARSPRQAVAAALGSPLPMAALPLRVATFALQGPEQGKVQLLIHAEIGSDYSASKLTSVGYILVDDTGRVVESQMIDGRLQPVMNGVPSALQFAGGASLPPGEYTLKLVAAEGDRVGSVEHSVHAAVIDAGDVKLSELMVGGPPAAGELLRPSVGHTVSFGSVHGYVEAYGPGVDTVTVKYEIATDPESPPLLTTEVPGRIVGTDRMIFTGMMPARQLPPGKYLLRAIVSTQATPIKTLTRTFEVAPPSVLMTSAEGTGTTSSAVAELFLPIDEQLLQRPFVRQEALNAETLELFRSRLEPSVKPAFDEGLASLTAGDYEKAEASLKRAIEPDVDSSTAIAYLAVVFAAAGHDAEAAGAWQTALADGAELPEVYDWLAQALLRTHSLSEARAVLEEASLKWPSDLRFVKPLAMMYATFGKGREAVRLLERYLGERRDDREALRLAVEWFYRVHSAGSVVHSRAEDLKLARAYAGAYANADGPQRGLVRQWLEFLEREKF